MSLSSFSVNTSRIRPDSSVGTSYRSTKVHVRLVSRNDSKTDYMLEMVEHDVAERVDTFDQQASVVLIFAGLDVLEERLEFS